ncbi:MAG: hypothetical protein JST16_08050 [Bdellovibrionales bacterium]|nr:hypothetical protein [Bdellovibrionales bacterium]
MSFMRATLILSGLLACAQSFALTEAEQIEDQRRAQWRKDHNISETTRAQYAQYLLQRGITDRNVLTVSEEKQLLDEKLPSARTSGNEALSLKDMNAEQRRAKGFVDARDNPFMAKYVRRGSTNVVREVIQNDAGHGQVATQEVLAPAKESTSNPGEGIRVPAGEKEVTLLADGSVVPGFKMPLGETICRMELNAPAPSDRVLAKGHKLSVLQSSDSKQMLTIEFTDPDVKKLTCFKFTGSGFVSATSDEVQKILAGRLVRDFSAR